MAAAFHDTFFAYILRLAFGSRVFPHPDEKTLPAIWQEKLSQVSPRDSAQSTLNEAPVADATSVLSETTAITRRGDPENGKDTFLVEWDGPTDPDVSFWLCDARFCSHTCSRFLGLLEPTELVECEEDMGHVPDVSSNIHHLRWICHLYCWDPVYLIGIPREHRRCDRWPDRLCRRLRTWSVVHSPVSFPF